MLSGMVLVASTLDRVRGVWGWHRSNIACESVRNLNRGSCCFGIAAKSQRALWNHVALASVLVSDQFGIVFGILRTPVGNGLPLFESLRV